MTNGETIYNFGMSDSSDSHGWALRRLSGCGLKKDFLCCMVEELRNPVVGIWNGNVCVCLSSVIKHWTDAKMCGHHFGKSVHSIDCGFGFGFGFGLKKDIFLGEGLC